MSGLHAPAGAPPGPRLQGVGLGLGSGRSAWWGQVGGCWQPAEGLGGPTLGGSGQPPAGPAPPGHPEASLSTSGWPAPGVQVSASVKCDELSLPTDVEPPPGNVRWPRAVVSHPRLTDKKMPVTVTFRNVILQ